MSPFFRHVNVGDVHTPLLIDGIRCKITFEDIFLPCQQAGVAICLTTTTVNCSLHRLFSALPYVPFSLMAEKRTETFRLCPYERCIC